MTRASLFAMSGAIAAVLTLAGFASTARAAIISVDWGANSSEVVQSGQTAGAPGAAATHWNTFIDTASHSSLIDDSGTTTAASVSTTLNGPFNWGSSFPAGGDFNLMTGGIYNNGLPSSYTPYVTVTGIPYAQYDVYVYAESDSSGRWVDYEIGATQAVMEVTYDSAYVLGQNYVILAGVSGSSFTLDMQEDPGSSFPQGIVSGLQIVQLPEPASLSLLGLGSVMILRRRGR